jgi:hypothetical protein
MRPIGVGDAKRAIGSLWTSWHRAIGTLIEIPQASTSSPSILTSDRCRGMALAPHIGTSHSASAASTASTSATRCRRSATTSPLTIPAPGFHDGTATIAHVVLATEICANKVGILFQSRFDVTE